MTEALLAAADPVAKAAAARAPQGATGELKRSIAPRPGVEGGVGIFMAWYGIFAEHGTVNEPARPFLVPAAEAGRVTVAEVLAVWLRMVV